MTITPRKWVPITPRKWVPITPRKWVPITPITPLFERAIGLYRRISKNIEEVSIFFQIEQNLGRGGKVDFNEGEGCANYPYNTPLFGRANDRL